MKAGGKYRFNLGFSANSAEEIRAGELLESLGQKKSVVVIAALNEYMDRHPEVVSGGGKIEIRMTRIMPENLESLVRKILEEKSLLGNTAMESIPQAESTEQEKNDILDMLGDLDFFN